MSVVTPTTVILPSAVWLEELTGELVRLGVDPQRARVSASKTLHRIVGHHGWPREVLAVAADVSEPDQEEGAEAVP